MLPISPTEILLAGMFVAVITMALAKILPDNACAPPRKSIRRDITTFLEDVLFAISEDDLKVLHGPCSSLSSRPTSFYNFYLHVEYHLESGGYEEFIGITHLSSDIRKTIVIDNSTSTVWVLEGALRVRLSRNAAAIATSVRKEVFTAMGFARR